MDVKCGHRSEQERWNNREELKKKNILPLFHILITLSLVFYFLITFYCVSLFHIDFKQKFTYPAFLLLQPMYNNLLLQPMYNNLLLQPMYNNFALKRQNLH